jgi:16S rRNA C967 or C1407 C5-methylase (RsmB/RsmF family)/NOL1/NOP2/fmu family ribosome biogenesis protein
MARRKDRSVQDASNGLPAAFVQRARALLNAEYETLEAALATPSPTSIRLNPRKPFALSEEHVPWCMNGRYLRERPSFTLDPLFHAGAYYVQEASSMLLEQAVITAGMMGADVLAMDLCAAPGGKSTHLLALLGKGALLVSNEVVPARRNILAENIWKSGAYNVLITGSVPAHLQQLPGCFDLILVDAPCSGEGMFRKDPFARQQWSPKLVEQCAAVQRGIMAQAWAALAPGGTLIYSTCTWEPAENEAQLLPLLMDGGICLALPLETSWGVVRTDIEGVIGHRCYPHRLRGEGFFISVVRKPGVRVGRRTAASPETESAVPWLATSSSILIREHNGILHAIPRAWTSEVETLSRAMRMHSPGIPFAEHKGDAWAPHPAAALSMLLERGALPEVELNDAQAIAYLSGEALPASLATGTALLTFAGHPLGWAQGAGGRWNNRWPAPWRIRTQRTTLPRVSWSEAHR